MGARKSEPSVNHVSCMFNTDQRISSWPEQATLTSYKSTTKKAVNTLKKTLCVYERKLTGAVVGNAFYYAQGLILFFGGKGLRAGEGVEKRRKKIRRAM